MAATPKTPKNTGKGTAFSQAVRALPKGARGATVRTMAPGAAVSAAAKAKVKPTEDIDGKILRSMPIAETHLKAIKKAYGVK